MLMASLLPFTPWHWLVLCLLLLVMEIAGTGGFLLWAGIAAGITALLLWMLPELSLAWQLFWFAVLAVISAVVWWQYLRRRKPNPLSLKLNRRHEHFVGRAGVLTEDVQAGRGRARFGDTTWIVLSEQPLRAGDNVVVVAIVDELSFRVELAE